LLKFFKNKSINQLNTLGVIFSASFILIFLSIAIYKEYESLQLDLKDIEREYINSQQDLLIKETSKIYAFLENKLNKENNLEKLLNEIEEIEFIKILDKSEIFIYTLKGLDIFNQKYIDIERFSKEHANQIEKSDSKISFFLINSRLKLIIGSRLHLDNINSVLTKKREKYQERINSFIFQTLFFSAIILFLAMMLSSSISKLISKEIGLFMIFFKNASKSYQYINKDRFSFSEFRDISEFVNEMIKDTREKDKELNSINQKLKSMVDVKTKKLRDKNRELKKSKDLTEKILITQDKFIKNSIHEINTPLSIILTNIDLLTMKNEKNRHLSKIEAGVKIIQNIYNDLSYTVKKDRVNYPKEIIDFSFFLKNRVEFFKEIAKGNLLTFELKVEENIYILFNDIELQRVIDNNISNAIKYSFEYSEIEIELYRDRDIVFEITNRANNIKETNKIFNRFYREHDSRGGFGIGLNIVKNICDKENVDISVQSENKKIKFKYSFKDSKDSNEYSNS